MNAQASVEVTCPICREKLTVELTFRSDRALRTEGALHVPVEADLPEHDCDGGPDGPGEPVPTEEAA